MIRTLSEAGLEPKDIKKLKGGVKIIRLEDTIIIEALTKQAFDILSEANVTHIGDRKFAIYL